MEGGPRQLLVLSLMLVQVDMQDQASHLGERLMIQLSTRSEHSVGAT